jgi:hypothetical protein
MPAADPLRFTVELAVGDPPTLELALRTAATGHVRPALGSRS